MEDQSIIASGSVVEVKEVQPLTPISDSTLIQLAEQAEKRIDAMTKIKRVALKLTNARDWIDQQGKPYLQASGAQKIARMFGISWRISAPEFTDHGDGHFTYTYKGTFALAGATIEAIGSRTSKDGFFKKYKGSGAERVELPPSEIDRGDVKKSAFTNCIGNGITMILGIRNLTYEDLAEFAQISKDGMSSVEYKEKGKAKEKIASTDASKVMVSVTDVRQFQGKKKNGEAYTLYTIHTDQGEYKTFFETIAKTAQQAKFKKLPVDIVFKKDQYGNTIESLVIVEIPAENGRDPGQEG